MSDIIDEIIDCLSPSDIQEILELETDSSRYSSDLDDLISRTRQIKINQKNRELKKEIMDLKAKTAENKNYLNKIKKDLEELKCEDEPEVDERSIKAYVEKINELKSQIKSLTKNYGGIDLNDLYNNIKTLNEEIQDYKKKIAEAKKMSHHFDGFPPNIEKGKLAIERVKAQIKINEALVESLH